MDFLTIIVGLLSFYSIGFSIIITEFILRIYFSKKERKKFADDIRNFLEKYK